jgi:2-oxoglutarate dehydrogenase E1 component
MTPKSLLRHPEARSSIGELVSGGFKMVIQDREAATRASLVDRVILCSGKMYYDLTAQEADRSRSAIIRIEQLSPFPEAELAEALTAFDPSAEICWVQEEPENMGAWTFVRHRIRALSGREPLYIGRSERASPAEGYAGRHARRQQALVESALRLGRQPARVPTSPEAEPS